MSRAKESYADKIKFLRESMHTFQPSLKSALDQMYAERVDDGTYISVVENRSKRFGMVYPKDKFSYELLEQDFLKSVASWMP